jgi:hypothetical protein
MDASGKDVNGSTDVHFEFFPFVSVYLVENLHMCAVMQLQTKAPVQNHSNDLKITVLLKQVKQRGETK